MPTHAQHTDVYMNSILQESTLFQIRVYIFELAFLKLKSESYFLKVNTKSPMFFGLKKMSFLRSRKIYIFLPYLRYLREFIFQKKFFCKILLI